MQVWSLSSGSSGNCYLVREGSTIVVVEAGISMSRVLRELSQLNLSPTQVAAVLVSHEHADHWSSAMALARRLRAPLICTQGTFESVAIAPGVLPFPRERLVVGRPLSLGTLSVEAFPLPHDAREPVGFLLRSPRATVCLATDMGIAGEAVIEIGSTADLVILEANHDVQMLMRGPYPAALKARILGQRGHICNEESARAVVRMATGRPRRFWLAHLSATNNSPRVALSAVQSVLRREGLGHLQVDVALRDRRSLFWDSDGVMEQLRLF